MEKAGFWNIANIISISRIFLLVLAIILLLSNSINLQIASIVLMFIVLNMDFLDGYVARKYNVVTKFGSVLDVMIDRIVENAYWITLAYVNVFPLWAPIIVIIRDFVTDGVRSMMLSQGKTTFQFMKSKLGYAIVASRWSRGLYNISKTVTFMLGSYQYIYKITSFEPLILIVVIWTVFFSLLRGIFTVLDAREYLSN